MRDPDYQIFQTFRHGVTAGILFPLPRTPALYEEQKKWRLIEDPLAVATREAENYHSLAEHVD